MSEILTGVSKPKYTTLHFRFENHQGFGSYPEFQQAQDKLEARLTSVFRRGEQNIFHIEEGGDDGEDQPSAESREEGFQLYGNFSRSLGHMLLKHFHPGEQITPAQVENFVEWYFNPALRSSEDMGWFQTDLIHTTPDRLIDRGHNITPLYEPAVLEDLKPGPTMSGNFSEFANGFKSYIHYHQNRDRRVANQLIRVVEEAEQNEKPTNIFVLRGTYHSGLVLMMPDNYRDSIYASSELVDYKVSFFEQAFRNAAIDEVINPNTLRKLYLDLLLEQATSFPH